MLSGLLACHSCGVEVSPTRIMVFLWCCGGVCFLVMPSSSCLHSDNESERKTFLPNALPTCHKQILALRPPPSQSISFHPPHLPQQLSAPSPHHPLLLTTSSPPLHPAQLAHHPAPASPFRSASSADHIWPSPHSAVSAPRCRALSGAHHKQAKPSLVGGKVLRASA